jgi:CheY-like chemotaxis protein
VDLVADAEEGLSHFDKNPYDLVIADFRLPNMDGLELAEAVKQRVPSCPVILITAYSDPAQGHLGKVSNVDVLLEKPVSMIRLHDALRRFFSTAIV